MNDPDRLEAGQLRRLPPAPDPLDELFRQLIGLIAGACQDAGMLDHEHGTINRYRQHFRNGEKPCAACRAANTRYSRDWRAANSWVLASRSAAVAVRFRAMRRLAAEYPERFGELLEAERTAGAA